MHEPPRERVCDEGGNEHEFQKVFRKHAHDSRHGGPQYLPDSNFFCLLLRGKRHQSKQSEAGNKYGEEREIPGELTHGIFGLIILRDLVVGEIIFEWKAGIELFGDFFHACNRFLSLSLFSSYNNTSPIGLRVTFIKA